MATLFFPLYSFLYHEFIIIQGGFGVAPTPYHLQIRSAYNLVMGEIPGAILTGDGLYLTATLNWAPWEPPVGSNDDSLAMLRATAALRRGKAKDYWFSEGCRGRQGDRNQRDSLGEQRGGSQNSGGFPLCVAKPTKHIGRNPGKLDEDRSVRFYF